MITEYKPPQITPSGVWDTGIFLAGTIDMGNSVDWQSKATELLTSKLKTNQKRQTISIYNPRRNGWDSTWEQKIDNPYFAQQVNWELDNLDKAKYILFNFLPNSKSPITLLELGLYAKSYGKCLVCCPPEFWRYGNVQIICNKYNIPLENNLELLIKNILI